MLHTPDFPQTQASTTPIWAIGLMSGTSLDGVDAALLLTDGQHILGRGHATTHPMPAALAQRLRSAMHTPFTAMEFAALERDITLLHAQAIDALLAESELYLSDIGVIGFHGQTLVHAPHQQISWQMGNPHLLVQRYNIPVIHDFRRYDIAHGGEGAPLVPLYHAALAREAGISTPVMFANIGGVSNITYLHDDTIIAGDTGFGNALLNDWVQRRLGLEYDKDGIIAASGRVDAACVQRYLDVPYNQRPFPKSLDRNDFSLDMVAHLSTENAAATLCAASAALLASALQHVPAPAEHWYICGGGRHNPVMMQALRHQLDCPISAVEALHLNGDMLEAEAFAYLAVRSMRGLALSLPSTTGASHAVSGGSRSGTSD